MPRRAIRGGQSCRVDVFGTITDDGLPALWADLKRGWRIPSTSVNPKERVSSMPEPQTRHQLMHVLLDELGSR